MPDTALGAALQAAVDAAFEAEQVPLLQRLVDLPSHTYARADVEASARALDEAAEALGLVCTRVPDHLGKFADHRIYAPPAAGDGPALALVGHIDTVFPRSLGFLQFRRDGDRVFGPGVLDMKSGLTSVLFALGAIQAVDPARFAALPIRFIVVSDEEVGSPSSRKMYLELAPKLTAGLVFESGRENDTIVTRRKGGGLFTITVRGKAAHAGNDHAAGLNAIHALAKIVDFAEGMTDYSRGVTLNVGLIEGGTAKNTVPALARCQIDARFETVADAERVTATLRSLAPDPFAVLPLPERLRGVTVEVDGGVTRPPMEASPASQRLRGVYEPYAAACGLQVGECPLQGGGSDANLLAADGVPCIDGLGPFGQYFHQTEEWSSLDSLRRRTAALAWFLVEHAGDAFRG